MNKAPALHHVPLRPWKRTIGVFTGIYGLATFAQVTESFFSETVPQTSSALGHKKPVLTPIFVDELKERVYLFVKLPPLYFFKQIQ